MTDFIVESMGQSHNIIHYSKLIRDWKTGDSKGFGFIEFTDPIYATVCIETCEGKVLGGREILVNQGKKKDADPAVYIKEKKAKKETEDEQIISNALDEAANTNASDELLDEIDAALFSEEDFEDGDEEFMFDRKIEYEGEVDPNLNREQRREASRRLKRKRPTNKGFG